jgi:NAD(P)-dependent dehydrogenase (short-subunit alcohol dehydrogenase family)
MNEIAKKNCVELSGQVAVVTGGGRGIGRACALTLARAGARTAVLARSGSEVTETAERIKEAGGQALAFVADVTNAGDISKTIEKIDSSLGPINLLVNNAGIPGPIGPFWETEADEWWRTMNVNLRGAVLCARAVLPGMRVRRQGRVINIASSAIPIAYFSSYATSKTALVRFTEIVAAEIKPYGVSMFAVGPGTVRTAMAEHSLYSQQGQKWLPWFQRIFDEGLDLPADRPSQLVLDLASGRADGLSGRFLSVMDDLDSLLRSVKEIEEQNLYSLRMRTLKAGDASLALASIRAEAERPIGPDS